MESNALKDLIYGGLVELIDNPRYYYHSSVSSVYSRFTEDGEKAVLEYMNIIAYEIKRANLQELDKRAKNMVLNMVKGDNN